MASQCPEKKKATHHIPATIAAVTLSFTTLAKKATNFHFSHQFQRSFLFFLFSRAHRQVDGSPRRPPTPTPYRLKKRQILKKSISTVLKVTNLENPIMNIHVERQ